MRTWTKQEAANAKRESALARAVVSIENSIKGLPVLCDLRPTSIITNWLKPANHETRV